jgi:hypothetical protein
VKAGTARCGANEFAATTTRSPPSRTTGAGAVAASRARTQHPRFLIASGIVTLPAYADPIRALHTTTAAAASRSLRGFS